GLIVVFFEVFARKVSLKGLSSVVFGMALGILLAWIFSKALELFLLPKDVMDNAKVFVTFVFIYFGLTLGLKGRGEFNLIIPYVKFQRKELKEEPIVIDTSIIIDARILDIVKTGFLEARFVVPRFVLNELQALADSTEHMKRQKGKRGIEVLHSLKKEQNIEVEIYSEDVEGVKSVDEKVVVLAQTLDAKILTTDYNLNRIAQLQGVKVLNINDLANALKPTFVAGERFNVKLIKEGKEHNQAIGYLEDGTMIVVENAKWLIGKNVDIEVTSILQSPSGRIIFTKLAQ
ncbi:MAG: PIN domain-containing protein, partial [Candidatus Omnitrophota bacterium]